MEIVYYCNTCGWEGDKDELDEIPTDTETGVVFCKACPECLSDRLSKFTNT
jgi:predicted RNA-binding Zn-ribbon protein involved in translation (DUF1610 family)